MKIALNSLWNAWILAAATCAVAPVEAQFGPPLAAPAPLNSNATSDSAADELPKLATDSLGHWVAVWVTKNGPYGSDEDILVATSLDYGHTWSAPLPLNTTAATDGSSFDRAPDLATDGVGTWIAVWSSNNSLGGTVGTDSDILFAKSIDDGLTWTAPQALASNAATDTGGDLEPSIAVTPSGTWIVAWSSNGGFGLDYDIKFARSMTAGSSWSSATALNTNAAIDFGDDTQVRLATDGASRWMAVWTSTDDLGGTIGTDTDILCARSTNGGVSWSAPAPVKTTAASDGTASDNAPCIATDGLGNWVCAWQSTDNLGGTIGSDFDILCARNEDYTGTLTWSAAIALNTNAASDSGNDWFPRIATDREGNWVAVWESLDTLSGTIGTDWDVLVARSSIAGSAWTAPEALNTNAGSDVGLDLAPDIATDRQGNWVAVWFSSDSLGGTIGNDEDVLRTYFTLPLTTASKYCFGDGLIGPCPCNNQSPIGAQEGCTHSAGTGGRLDALGNPYVPKPTLTLYASALPIPPASVLHIYLQGNVSLSTPPPFGDGLRCIGGTLKRIGTLSGPGGSTYGYTSGTNLALVGQIPFFGGTYYYQVWFRDSHSHLCTPANTFNLSGGLSVVWYP